jgi:alkylation response protein AidB-like acyl-CoA dehydrogenase
MASQDIEHIQAVREIASAFGSTILSEAPEVYSQLGTQGERFRSLRPLYGQAAKSGLIASQIPQAYGGTGSGSLVDAAILTEEFYAVETNLSLTVLGTGLGLSVLFTGKSGGYAEDFLEPFLRPFLTGEGEPLASLVHSEPGGTANWLEKGGKGLSTTAWLDGDEWVVDGEKVRI